MKVMFGLCLIAVLLSLGEASRTYRGGIVSDKCEPGHCLVKGSDLCRCGIDGNLENASCDFVIACNCKPGEKFYVDVAECTCPSYGVITPIDCRLRTKRSGARRMASQSVDSFHRFATFDQEIPPNCGLYEVVGEYEGQLVCEPCMEE